MKNAKDIFKQFSKDLGNFIAKWNEDPENRDKTYNIFKEL